MRFRALHAEFENAGWKDRRELADFVARARDASTADVARLIPLLLPTSRISTARRNARLQAFVELSAGHDGAKLFGQLLEAAVEGDAVLRRVVRPALVSWCDARGLARLAVLLRHPDPGMRRYAADIALAVGGGGRALDALSAAFKEGPVPRAEAIEVAVGVAGAAALRLVAPLVTAGSPPERAAACAHLGTLTSARRKALEALSPALQDTHLRVVQAAVTAYGRLAPRAEFFSLVREYFDREGDARVREAVVRSLAAFPDPETVAEIAEIFRGASPLVRTACVETAGAMGRNDVLPFLEEALGDGDLGVRNAALGVVVDLVAQGELDTDRMLLWLLRSSDLNVKRQAIEVVHQVGEPLRDLCPRLLKMLRDEDWWVRERAVETLVEIAGDELTRHILKYLRDPSDVIRRYAVEVLARIADPTSIAALITTLETDDDWWVRERAIECFAAIGDPSVVPELVAVVEQAPALLRTAIPVLGTLAHPAAVPLLSQTLADPEPDLRLLAIEALAEVGDTGAAEAIEPLLQDPDHRVRAAADQTLIRWKSEARTDGSRVAGQLSGLELLLWRMTAQGGDDLFLISEERPFMKHLGRMTPLHDRKLGRDVVEEALRRVMTPVQRETLEERGDVDFSVEVKSRGLRFRANVLQQRTGLAAVFRRVSNEIHDFGQLGLPESIRSLCKLPQGLVLIGGPTGSGKSTTLAAMIDHVNRTSTKHIVTIEDPIEVVHENHLSLITQREVGSHTHSFSAALKSVLREDPDVILVGEIRDLTTISFAVQAAETGHLVLGTVHTVSADATVDRLIDAFPVRQQAQIRTMLSQNLSGVVCQQLVRKTGGRGRVAAVEVMLVNDAVANLIRRGQCYQIPSVITTHRHVGMQSMDEELMRLVLQGDVEGGEAYVKAADKKAFQTFLENLEGGADAAH